MEDVLNFEVPVGDWRAMGVHVMDATADLMHHVEDLALIQLALMPLDVVHESAFCRKVHEDQVCFSVVIISQDGVGDELADVGMVLQAAPVADLSCDSCFIGFIHDIYLFDSILLGRIGDIKDFRDISIASWKMRVKDLPSAITFSSSTIMSPNVY